MSGKKYNEVVKNLDLNKFYDAKEALDLLVKSSYVKFDETVEFHARLGVDGRQADQQIRGVVVLPAGTGKKLKVLVIAKGDKQEEATKAGADIVGAEDVVAKIAGGWLDFDVCITTPDMMGVIGRVAKVLGPKGLMPNPKSGTVTTNLSKAIADVKAGKVEYRLDKNNIVHCSIGKVSFGADKLFENFKTLLDAITKAKPASAKGTYFKSLTLSTTMGPGLKIETTI